ncbi:hypothetical protein SAY87_004146 [Trapa incisa]|uniref:Uncharacterized protein n=1 Tax=Trapa incisa TaxID=236973 RepID=A0AAN7PLL1_9MYRT|nr:hypothetical protein SAY87_004146 [Trapa incisa]
MTPDRELLMEKTKEETAMAKATSTPTINLLGRAIIWQVDSPPIPVPLFDFGSQNPRNQTYRSFRFRPAFSYSSFRSHLAVEAKTTQRFLPQSLPAAAPETTATSVKPPVPSEFESS